MLPLLQRIFALVESVGVIVLFFLGVMKLDRDYFARILIQRPLALAVAFLTMLFALIGCQFVLCVVVCFIKRARKRRSEAARSQIVPLLLAWLDGDAGMMEKLARFAAARPGDFQTVLVGALGMVTGSRRERLAELAVKLDFVRRWKLACASLRWHQRKDSLARLALVAEAGFRVFLRGALWDTSPRVRTEAVRALLRLGDRDDLGLAFGAALRLPPLSRVFLAEELRPFAATLAATHLPEILRGGSPEEVLAALSVLECWGLALEVPGFEQCLASDSVAVRVAATRISPLVTPADRALRALQGALASQEPALLRAGVLAAGRLHDSSLLPAVARCASSGDEGIARQACTVLAAMGARGSAALESRAMTAAWHEAACAVEALETACTRPCGVA